jgi:hypothetical protein
MTAGYTPQYRYIGVESERLANADLSERDRHSEEDHSAHSAGKSARAAAARSRPGSPPAAAVKWTGRTTSALSLRANPEFA